MSARVLTAAIASALFTLALVAALVVVPDPGENLPAQVTAEMARSGVDHPITAVLLNFRSYDTLLEVAVLMVAAAVAFAVRQVEEVEHPAPVVDNSVLGGLLRLLIPLVVMVAVYQVWSGSHQPGGAFQSGALVAAIGILLRLTGTRLPEQGPGPTLVNIGLVAGFVVFLAAAVMAVAAGRPLLTYPVEQAGALILAIELSLALSIGLILINLFTLAPTADRGGR